MNIIDQGKNLIIGIFVIVGCVLLIVSLLFIHPSVGDNGRILKVRFTDLDKVNVGTRVTFAGRPVGEVISIREIEEARNKRINHQGDVYVYEATLQVDSGINIFNTDTVSVRTSGLLGEKNISINPEPLKPGESLQLMNDQLIYAEPVGGVEDALKQLASLSSKIDKALDGITTTLNDINKERIWEKVANTVKNLNDITDALNKPETWTAILNNIHDVSAETKQRLPKSWNTIDDSLARFQSASRNIDEASVDGANMMRNGNKILNKISQGEGTIGKIIEDNELYLRIKSILSKGETIADDINNFGILFHLNKKWQRLNAWRLDLKNKLSNPDVFQAYFDYEIDRIGASLNNVAEVLREAERQPCYQTDLLFNPEYTKKFADLIKEVEDLEEALKMYNQQVIDMECCN